MDLDKHISITIGGKTYPMVVHPEEEALVRQVEREIQDKIQEFQNAYSGLSVQDCLAMSLITTKVELQTVTQEQQVVQKQVAEMADILESI